MKMSLVVPLSDDPAHQPRLLLHLTCKFGITDVLKVKTEIINISVSSKGWPVIQMIVTVKTFKMSFFLFICNVIINVT